MVDPYNVIQAEAVGDSFDPPLIFRVTVHFPVVQRVSPELSCSRKSIWRASCYLYRAVFLIQFKEPRICPGICAVHCNVDRDVTDDLDSLFVCIRFECHPLLAEFELHIFLEFDFEIHFFSVVIQSVLPAKADILSPLAPRNTAEAFLHCHKKCIVLEPPCFFFLKSAELRIHINITSLICLAEKLHTSFV